MAFNIDLQEYLNDIKSSIISLEVGTAAETVTVIEEYIANLEERFAALMNYVATEGTTKEALLFVVERLKEEKDILWSEVLSLVQIAESKAQTVVNTVKGIIVTAISDEIGKMTS